MNRWVSLGVMGLLRLGLLAFEGRRASRGREENFTSYSSMRTTVEDVNGTGFVGLAAEGVTFRLPNCIKLLKAQSSDSV